MDTLPLEVLRIICTHLDFKSAANVRYLTRNLAVIASEFLVTRVCFHTSLASLERLENIANHAVFSQTVKVLVYEAALLADVKCRHEYASHFEHDHFGLEKPKDPPASCSARERRLYLRNKRKWTQAIYARYESYRVLYIDQKFLIDSKMVEQVLLRCMPKFPKLTFIDIDPIRRCSHVTSARFLNEFGTDCALPLSGNFGKISHQLKWMLLPGDHVIQSLRKLEIHSLSPSFFELCQKTSLQAAFKPLTDIDIILRMTDTDINAGETLEDCLRRHLSTGVLQDALSAAERLEFLSIGVDPIHPMFIDVNTFLSNTTWSQLKSLGLSTVSSTQAKFIDTLKRQPKLEALHLALMQLTDGNWPDTITQMRHELHLQTFLPVGFLEDSHDTWPMDLIDVSAYMEDLEEVDLGSAIDLYVTDDLELVNPLTDGFEEYEDPHTVREMYFDLNGSDGLSNLSDADIPMTDSDMSTTDSDVSMTDSPDWTHNVF